MIAKLLPVLFLIGGVGAGAGAGLLMGPSGASSKENLPQDTEAVAQPDNGAPGADGRKHTGEAGLDFEYLNLTKQFVIPVVERDRIAALVMLSLSLEASPGMGERFYAVEPKLRDGFLQVLFDHANMGGFDGAFTQSDRLTSLREALLVVAQRALGPDISQVLIMSVARQDA
ncbi:flagellar basal body-associated protein FliL [Ruegeria sediminis]|uniref:Flagellar basal body-associated protein FliL n=1 Tax=Ruegeria sediminis TaxID=2583820 RepID=A0ABY2WXD1_9RHOB|nr:flagellar basal body-associated protein FliL [Ruegeria sediminis]TMV07097.1 flagellar basal body-associated protein FliL [Ruegeria sediminis]